jgi:hypothetical protein
MLWATINAIGVFLSPSLEETLQQLRADASLPAWLLRLSRNHVLFGGQIVFDAENIGLTANLTVFNVSLAFALGVVNDDFIPFPATRALKASVHEDILR